MELGEILSIITAIVEDKGTEMLRLDVKIGNPNKQAKFEDVKGVGIALKIEHKKKTATPVVVFITEHPENEEGIDIHGVEGSGNCANCDKCPIKEICSMINDNTKANEDDKPITGYGYSQN